MDYSKYLNQANTEIPADIAEKISIGGNISPLNMSRMNSVLEEKELWHETGFIEMADGNYLVAMYCPMPGVTREMIDWWFWWHVQDKERYVLWYPGEHFDNGYAKKDKAYFTADTFPGFQENTQYPVERVGAKKAPLSIEFVTPEHFGFNRNAMDDNHVAAIVCGHVGILKGLIKHTEMAHIFFEAEDGLFMVSRFWMGNTCKNKMVHKLVASEESARSMAAHCCVEYRNLAHKLPSLYTEFGKR